MSVVAEQESPPIGPEILRSGDRLHREEFHRIYCKTPEKFKAELLQKVVFVASPMTNLHATSHVPLSGLFFIYQSKTPGTEAGDNATVILDDENEPQPDLYLRILPEFGGRSRLTDDHYILGPPELLAEIAYSSRSIDLHTKREVYAEAGVREYLVLSLREPQLHWFDLTKNEEIAPDDDGVCRLRSFPGLWIHAAAVVSKDHQRMIDVLRQGMASPEHAEFVKRLEAAKTK